MAENDPETEEIEEDDQQYQPSVPKMGTSTDEPELATTPITQVNLTTTTTTDMTPEENQFAPVIESVPNAMPIPTSMRPSQFRLVNI